MNNYFQWTSEHDVVVCCEVRFLSRTATADVGRKLLNFLFFPPNTKPAPKLDMMSLFRRRPTCRRRLSSLISDS